ncbi:MAG: hypothetical protein ABIH47_01060 [Candidatus Omnitrophota bacterium]
MDTLTVGDDLDVRGRIFDGAGIEVDILDDLSVSNDLTVAGMYIGGTADDGFLRFRNDTEQLFWDESDNEFELTDDVYLGGVLTATDGAVIGSDTGDVFIVRSRGLNIEEDGALSDVDSEVEVRDDLSVSGSLTVSKTLRIGNAAGAVRFNAIDDDNQVNATTSLMNAANDLYVEGDIEIGGNLSLGGDVTIIGVIFSDDYTRIMDALTASDDLDVRGQIYDGAGSTIDIVDDVSISGDLSVWGSDIYVGGAGGDDDTLWFSGGQRRLYWDDTQSEFQFTNNLNISGSLTVSDGAVIGDATTDIFALTSSGLNVIQNGILYDNDSVLKVQDDLSVSGDLTILGSTRFGNETYDSFILISSGLNIAENGTMSDTDGMVRIYDDLSITGELSVGEGIIVAGTDISRFGQSRVYIGSTDPSNIAQQSGDLYVEQDMEILRNLSVGGDMTFGGTLTVLGSIFAQNLTGTIADTFTIDSTDLSDTPTLAFRDSDGDETFRWNDLALNSFELSDDLSVGGSLTVEKELIVNGSDISRFNQGRVYIGSSNPSILAQDSGDLYVAGDVEIGGDLSLAKDTTIAGVIFSDDYTRVMGPLTASQDLDVRGKIYDGAGPIIDIVDDVSISGDLSVWGQDIYVSGTNDDGTLRFRNNAEQLFWDESDNEFELTDDVYLGGVLTATDGAMIGSDTGDVFIVRSSGLNLEEDGALSDAGSAVEVRDDLSVSGGLTVSKTFRIGNVEGAVRFNAIDDDNQVNATTSLMDAPNDLYVEGDVEIGGDLSIGKDTTIAGVIFSDDYTRIMDPLTVSDDLDVRGRIYDSTGIDIDILDNLSISGHTTVDGILYIADNTTANNSDGRMNIGRNASGWEFLSWSDSTDRFLISNDLELEESTVSRLYFNDGSGEGQIHYDAEDYGFHINNDLSISGDLTVMDGYISSVVDIDINPVIGSARNLTLGASGESDTVWLYGNTTVSGYLTVSGDVTISGILSGSSPVIGTKADIFTIDIDDTTVTPTLAFEDGSVDETLRWNDTIESFELSDDLSMAGELTIGGNRIVFENGETIDNLDDNMIYLSNNVSIDGSVTIGGDLTVYGSGITVIPNGRVVIGDEAGNVEASQSGDLYIENDLTVDGILYAATLSGILIANSTITESFIIDKNSFIETIDVTLYFSDDTDDNAHYLQWKDDADEFIFSDDMTISGGLSVFNELRVEGADASRFSQGSVIIGSDNPSPFASGSNDLYVQGDVEIGGDLSIGKDTTIAGVIFSDDYTRIMSSLTASQDLDVRGRIYDGAGEIIDVTDDLSISGDMTIWGAGATGIQNGRLYVGSGTPTDVADDSGDVYVSEDIEAGGDVSLGGDLTVLGSTRLDDGTSDSFILVSSGLNIAANGTIADTDSMVRIYDDLSITGELSIAEDVTVQGTGISRFSRGRVYIGSTNPSNFAQQNGDLYVEQDVEILKNLSVGGNATFSGMLSVGGDIYAGSVLGTRADTFTIDTDDTTNTPTLAFRDSDGDETFRWNDLALNSFELSDDLSLGGSLTTEKEVIINGSGISRFSSGRVYIGSTNPSTFAQDSGDLYVAGDIEIGGDLSLGKDTTIAGVIFSDDYTRIMGPLIASQDLDVRGRIYDGTGAAVDIVDDVSVSGDLRVLGQDIYVGGTNDDGTLRFRNDTEQLFWDESEHEFELTDDTYLAGVLTTTDGAVIGNDTGDVFIVTSSGLNIEEDGGLSDVDSAVEIRDSLSASGSLTVSGTVRLGYAEGAVEFNAIDDDNQINATTSLMNASNDLYVEGDVEIGGDLSIGKDTTIAGVIFSDDYTKIMDSLTAGDDLDVRGRMYDGAGIDIDILDNLSISGHTTINGILYVADNTVGSDSDGLLNIGRNSNEWEYVMWDDSADRFLGSDDLELVTSTVSRLYFDDGSGEGQIHFDVEDYGFHANNNLSISGDLTVMGGYVSSETDININPVIGSASNLTLGVADESDTVWLYGNTTISGYLTVGGDITISDVLFGSSPVTGTKADIFTIDSDDTTTTPTLAFEDGSVDETLRWNDTIESFELSDDLSTAGELTIGGNRLAFENGETINTLDDNMIYLSNNVSIDGAVTIGGDLTVYGSGISVIPNGRVVIGDASGNTLASQSGDLYVENDVTVNGNLEVLTLSNVTSLASTISEFFILDRYSAVEDMDVILYLSDDTDDAAHYLAWDDGNDEFQFSGDSIVGISEDVTISGDVTVMNEIRVEGAGASRFSRGSVIIGDDAPSILANGSNDLYVKEDIEIGSDLSVGGDTTIVGRMSVAGELSVDGTGVSRFSQGRVYIGSSNPSLFATDSGDFYVEGDVEIGGNLSIGKNTTIAGVIFSDDYTQVMDNLTVGEDLDVRGRIYDGAGAAVDVLDDLSVSGDLTVLGSTRLGDSSSDSFILVSSGLNVAENGTIADTDSAIRIDNDLSITGELSIGEEITIEGDGISRFRRGRVYIGSNSPSSLAQQSGDLYIERDVEIGGDLSIGKDTTIAGVIFSDDYTEIVGRLTASDDIDVRGRIYDGTGIAVDILDDLSVSNDLTVWGRDIYIGGAAADGFIRFRNNAEQFFWDESDSEFEISDDVYLAGALTATDDTIIGSDAGDVFIVRSSGLNIEEDGALSDAGSAVEVRDDLSVSGSLTVSKTLRIGNAEGAVRFNAIDDDNQINATTSLMNASNDLYVEGDVEIGGNLSIGKNTTIAGVIFSDDYTQVMDNLTVGEDLDVRGRIYDGGEIAVDILDDLSVSGDLRVWGEDIYVGGASDDGAVRFRDKTEQLLWNESDTAFELTDDVSINGVLTTAGGAVIGEDTGARFILASSGLNVAESGTISAAGVTVEIWDDLSIGENLTITGGNIFGVGIVQLNLGEADLGVTQLTGDFTVSNDVTIGGDLSIGADLIAAYVEVIGDTMTGALNINTPGATALDVDGDIIYTGTLRNQSPVKVADGLDITNFGGIKGGQILLKDVIVAFARDMFVHMAGTLRILYVPEIKFLRFTEKRPIIHERRVQVTIDLASGGCELPLAENEHIVRIVNIICPDWEEYFVENIGLDRTIMKQGEYRIQGQRTIAFWKGDETGATTVTVQYVCREDIDEPHIVEFTLEEREMKIEAGWQIVYVREEPLDIISGHDTAAMSTKTTLTLGVVPINEFEYTADSIVVGVVTEEGNVNQYF